MDSFILSKKFLEKSIYERLLIEFKNDIDVSK